MTSYANNIVGFFVTNFPSAKVLAVGGPVALLWAVACLTFAGFLKTRMNRKTVYTRKIFHFLIFDSSGNIFIHE